MRTASHFSSVILVLAAIHASPLFGQVPTKPAFVAEQGPVEWWTLTDDITPQELRAIHEDVELHQERYREAARAGIQDRLPEESMELLSFYVNGYTHPELFQMWSVFDSFAVGFGYELNDPVGSLVEFGFEGEALATIVEISSAFERQRKILQAKVEAGFEAVSELDRLSRENLGPASYKIARHARDANMLAHATGFTVQRVEELLGLWDSTPANDFAARTLPLLRKALGPADWNRFRSYLLTAHAPMMWSVGFSEPEEN